MMGSQDGGKDDNSGGVEVGEPDNTGTDNKDGGNTDSWSSGGISAIKVEFSETSMGTSSSVLVSAGGAGAGCCEGSDDGVVDDILCSL